MDGRHAFRILNSEFLVSLVIAVTFFIGAVGAQQASRGRFDAGTISGLPARNIGSAEMSGRVAAVAALDDNGRVTVIVGSASGGVWKSVDGGSTFKPVFDNQDVYAEAQGGEIGRVNRLTHQVRAIKPYARYGEKKLRFNWNTPIQISPTDRNTLYLWSQYLYRSRDKGQSWDRISSDLSTNDPEKQKQEASGGVTIDNSAAEMNTTVYSISESPRNAQIIWAGTDDGNVQVTRDGGKSWTNVVANVPGLGSAPIVSWVEAGRYADGEAYATFDRHMSGDMTPHAYKITDFGRTWRALIGPANNTSGIRGYAHVIKEDPVNRNLLYVGTEFGLWVSIDGGDRWAQYKGTGFRAVAVRDLVVHLRTSDLVLATHGRGIWIIDDISPWRALTPSLLDQTAGFLPVPRAVQSAEGFGGWAEGDNAYTGPSRPTDAALPYFQKSRHVFGDLKIEIFDQNGTLVDTVASSKRRGVNRAMWSMRLKPPHVPPAAATVFGAVLGPRVPPGTYTVKLTKGDQVYSTTLDVVLDPRAPYTVDDRRTQFALVERISGLLDHLSWAVDAIVGVRDAAAMRASKLPSADALRQRLSTLAETVDKIRAKIVATKEGGMITGEERLREYMGGLYGDVNGYDGRPTDEQVSRSETLGRELDDVVREFTTLTAQELPPVNRQLRTNKMEPIEVLSEDAWRSRNK